MMFILFAVAILFITPFASAFGAFNEQQILQNTAVELQEELINEIEHIRGIESTSFLSAFKGAIRALVNNRDDDFSSMLYYLLSVQ